MLQKKALKKCRLGQSMGKNPFAFFLSFLWTFKNAPRASSEREIKGITFNKSSYIENSLFGGYENQRSLKYDHYLESKNPFKQSQFQNDSLTKQFWPWHFKTWSLGYDKKFVGNGLPLFLRKIIILFHESKKNSQLLTTVF